jgi:tetratricopeptide (TPR) repeat protein
VGERRFMEPRLTGGFRFGPIWGTRRGAEPSEAERWSVLASAGELKARSDKAPTPANRRALAAAELLIDETEGAVGLLEQLVREFPSDASVQSDLAAAYIARALRTGREDDWLRALGAAETAVRLDPALIEARFNRALALEFRSPGSEAQAAWRAYLDSAGVAEDGWAQEARRRLEALTRRPAADPNSRK